MNTRLFLSPARLIRWSILLALVLFLSVNVIAGNTLRQAKIDLTENRLYTLSEGTRQLLANLEEPIHLRFFVSEELVEVAPQLAAYANRVRAMLETYADLSNGKITLEVIDPEPFSAEEDRAVGLGVNGFTVGDAGEKLFFGLAGTNSTDGKAVIPIFSPDREEFLEYDLTRLVAKLGQGGRPVVVVIDGIGLGGDPMAQMPKQQLLVQMEELFDLRMLGGEIRELPEDTRVVMVAHPKKLSEGTRYVLDQWVLKGGATLIFVDPYAEAQAMPRPGMPPVNPTSDLPELFKAWGVTYDPAKAVADPENGLRATRQVAGQAVTATNPQWLAIQRSGMAEGNPALAELSTIIMTTAGAFEAASEKVTLIPLLFSSPSAGLVSAATAGDPLGDPRRLIDEIEPAGKPLALATRLSGELATAFPDGPPEGVEVEEDQLKASAAPANVVLVADADMLTDRTWIERGQLFGQEYTRAFANNGDFVLNVIEQMAGGVLLADLRGRGVSWRPFTRLEALAKAAEEKYLAKQQELMQRISDTETKLRTLSDVGQGDTEVMSPETLAEIERFRADLLAARAELRDVQYNLRRDVDRLETWITMLNVGLIPALVGAVVLAFALRRPRRAVPRRGSGVAAT